MLETISNTCQGHCNQYLNISFNIYFKFKVYKNQNISLLDLPTAKEKGTLKKNSYLWPWKKKILMTTKP